MQNRVVVFHTKLVDTNEITDARTESVVGVRIAVDVAEISRVVENLKDIEGEHTDGSLITLIDTSEIWVEEDFDTVVGVWNEYLTYWNGKPKNN